MMETEKPCRHEYVKIFQRKLKGLERRLVATRAFLPIGFKAADFGHLSEGSFCFCSKCRARLFPKRTQQEKLAARVALAESKAAQARELLDDAIGDMPDDGRLSDDDPLSDDDRDNDSDDSADSGDNEVTVHVEELELESVDVQDIQAEGVKLSDNEESCDLAEDGD